MGKFINLLLSRDNLAHPINMNYKGNSHHPTLFGSVVSIGISIFATIYMVEKILSMIHMSAPETSIFTRPLFVEEVASLGNAKLFDYGMTVGVGFLEKDNSTVVPAPDTIGRWYSVKKISGS